MDFLNSSDGVINGALTKAWQITLTGTNGALKFVNFEPGDLLTLVIKEDASGSNYTLTFPSSVVWQAKAAPNRDLTANAVSVYTFSYDGANFRDAGGAGGKLPSRISSGALSTIALVGAGASIILNLSSGNGQGPGNLSAANKVYSNSGAQLLTVIDGSGSVAVGSGSVVAGSLATRPAQTVTSVVLKGVPGNKVAAGTGTVIVNGAKGGAVCYADTDGVGYTKCDANNGTVTCKVATVKECL